MLHIMRSKRGIRIRVMATQAGLWMCSLRLDMRQKGYTLIEILLVIAIIAILSGIAIYSFRDVRYRSDLKNGARSFEADVKRARSMARTMNEDILIGDITPGGQNYTITRVRGNRQLLAGRLTDGVVFRSGAPFLFNGKGMTQTEQVIVLESRRGISDQYRLTISITGFMRMERSSDGVQWAKAW